MIFRFISILILFFFSSGIFILFDSTVGGRYPAAYAEYGVSKTNELQGHIQKYLKYIPDDKLKNTIGEYVKEVSVIHNGANESIEVNNQKFLSQNACFAELSSEFYLNLQAEDLLQLDKRLALKDRPLGVRIALDEEAGKGFWADKAPGFLWEKIMSFTDGDANLAVQIIKMCGHDDRINEKPYLSSSHPAYTGLKQKQKLIFQRARAALKDKAPWIADSLDTQEAGNKINFGCWENSSLYLPKSLGPEVAIDDGLKSRIAQVQAPSKGAAALPAKNYHVLAGLFTGCRFKVETGYSFVGAQIARLGARYYRAKSLGALRLSATPPLPKDQWSKISKNYFSDNLIRSMKEARVRKMVLREKAPKEDIDPLLVLLNPLSDERIAVMSNEQIRNHIWKNVSQIDAADLWKSWYEKVNVPGVGELYLPNRSRRNEYLTGVGGAPVKNDDVCGQIGWSKERCSDAVAVADSWETDFEWSQEAQYSGARAGERLCKPANTGDLEKSACKILAARKIVSGRYDDKGSQPSQVKKTVSTPHAN